MLMWLGLVGMGASDVSFIVDGSIEVTGDQSDVSAIGADAAITATGSSPDITVQT